MPRHTMLWARTILTISTIAIMVLNGDLMTKTYSPFMPRDFLNWILVLEVFARVSINIALKRN